MEGPYDKNDNDASSQSDRKEWSVVQSCKLSCKFFDSHTSIVMDHAIDVRALALYAIWLVAIHPIALSVQSVRICLPFSVPTSVVSFVIYLGVLRPCAIPPIREQTVRMNALSTRLSF